MSKLYDLLSSIIGKVNDLKSADTDLDERVKDLESTSGAYVVSIEIKEV